MKTFWKTHPALRIVLMIVLFVLSIALVELIRVIEMMYSFQKDRKLNRIMVMIDGFAIGKMMRVMVEK